MKLTHTLLLAAALAPLATAAQTVTTFSQAGVSYLYGAPSGTPRYESNKTGATTQASIAAITSYNGIEAASATASLSTAALKAFSGGTANDINGNAYASFGDTFGAVNAQTGLAHDWINTDTVRFSFSVTGAFGQSRSADDMALLDQDFERSVLFTFAAYRPGAFDRQTRIEELMRLPYNAAIGAEWTRLNNEITALRITSGINWLGQVYSPYFDGSQVPFVPVNDGLPSVISIEFNPGGAFEWRAGLDVTTRFLPDAPLSERTTFVADFSHTVGASFSGPAGTITTSGSGLFPDTVAMQPVPEPGTWALMLAGGLGLLGLARRRHGAQAGPVTHTA